MSSTRMQAFVGPMFSSKTEALHGQLRRQAHARRTVVLFHHTTDTRDDRSSDALSAHDGGSSFEPARLPSKAYIKWVEHSVDILRLAHELKAEVIGVDEGQFFDDGLVGVLSQLHREGVKVFYAGLDTNWLGQPFTTTTHVIECPEVNVHKMTAVCSKCGNETATRSLKRDALGANPGQVIDIGGGDKYEAVCAKCFAGVMGNFTAAT